MPGLSPWLLLSLKSNPNSTSISRFAYTFTGMEFFTKRWEGFAILYIYFFTNIKFSSVKSAKCGKV